MLSLCLISNNISYGISREHSFCLLPSTIFSVSNPGEGSIPYRATVLSDMKLLTVCSKIAHAYLVDACEPADATAAVRDAFRDDPELAGLATGIAESLVVLRSANGVIKGLSLLYSRAGRNYKVLIYRKDKVHYIKKGGHAWAIFNDSGAFKTCAGIGIQVVELEADIPKEDMAFNPGALFRYFYDNFFPFGCILKDLAGKHAKISSQHHDNNEYAKMLDILVRVGLLVRDRSKGPGAVRYAMPDVIKNLPPDIIDSISSMKELSDEEVPVKDAPLIYEKVKTIAYREAYVFGSEELVFKDDGSVSAETAGVLARVLLDGKVACLISSRDMFKFKPYAQRGQEIVKTALLGMGVPEYAVHVYLANLIFYLDDGAFRCFAGYKERTEYIQDEAYVLDMDSGYDTIMARHKREHVVKDLFDRGHTRVKYCGNVQVIDTDDELIDKHASDGDFNHGLMYVPIKGETDMPSAMRDELNEPRLGSGGRESSVYAILSSSDMRRPLREHHGRGHEWARSQPNNRFADIGYEDVKGTMVNRLGWSPAHLDWVLKNPDEVESVLRDAQEIRDRYKYVVFCGMGGSGLSVQTVKTTFGEKDVKIYSLRTTDPAAIAEILDELGSREAGDLKKALDNTLVVAITKSGTTEETLRHKEYFEGLFREEGIPAKEHMWVLTDEGSPITENCPYPIRAIQLNQERDIGGRFTSPCTRIFLLPLALAAPERVWPILRKAKEMNRDDGDIMEDEFSRLGAFLFDYAANQDKDKLTILVPEELKDIPLWAEQLIEESLGKDGKGVTLFYGEKLKAGELAKPENNDRVFLRINLGDKKTDEELWRYLNMDEYPVFEVTLDDLNAVGGLMHGLQRAVATVGYLWNINFINQKAVEDYKKATRKIMKAVEPGEEVKVPEEWETAKVNQDDLIYVAPEYKHLKLYYKPLLEVGAVSVDELQVEVAKLGGTLDNAPCVYAAVLNILRQKPGFEAAELTSYGKMSQGLRQVLEAVRYDIFTKGYRMPSKLGEGPDKNHSYQQNLEDGKNMFFSTYLLQMGRKQPEPVKFNENLLRAQAIGTVQSMQSKGRKSVLFTSRASEVQTERDVNAFFKEVRVYLGQRRTRKEEAMDRVSEAEEDMHTIHDMNMDLLPPVEKGKVLLHLIPIQIVPYSLRSRLSNLCQDRDSFRERIELVPDGRDIAQVAGDRLSEGNYIVDVAVIHKGTLARLPNDVNALFFTTRAPVANFRQLEAIIAALRAVHTKNARAMIDLYEVLSGERFPGDITQFTGDIFNDPQGLAKLITFELEPISIPDKNRKRDLNDRLFEFITKA